MVQAKLLTCKKCGEKEKPNPCGNYFLEIEVITPKIRKSLKKFSLPADYTHYISCGFGSIYDTTVFFFTKEQITKLPKILCDNCFTDIFGGKKLLCFAYFEPDKGLYWEDIPQCACGQVRNKKLENEKGELYFQRKITQKMRSNYNIESQYQSCVIDFYFFNYKNAKKMLLSASVFLLKEKISRSRTICSNCLHEKIKGQRIAVIDSNKKKRTSFVVK